MSTHQASTGIPASVSRAAGTLEAVANFLTLLSALAGLGAVLAGIGLATVKDTTSDSLGVTASTHPFVLAGIGAGLMGLAAATALLLLAQWARTYATTITS